MASFQGTYNAWLLNVKANHIGFRLVWVNFENSKHGGHILATVRNREVAMFTCNSQDSYI